FEQVYGPEGEWVRLFGRDARYRGTRLLRDVGRERVYVAVEWWGSRAAREGVYGTVYCWESREAYEEFRQKFAAEYAEIDERCEALTITERQMTTTLSDWLEEKDQVGLEIYFT